MTDVPDISRPSELWKQMSPEARLRAAEAFWRGGDAAMEQAEVVAAVAQRLKFRPKSVVALSVDRKSRYLLGLPTVSESVAARLLVAYHLAHQRPMMASLLDALGIAHEDGLIADDEVDPPGIDRLKAAAETLGKQYPREDIALYFSTLIWQDAETWGPLAEILDLPKSSRA